MRMIRVYTASNPHDWDQILQPLLYAYRSVPQERTGFSPFELLLGRKVQGPFDLLRQNWEEQREQDLKTVIQYLDTLMNSLQQSLKLASENLQRQQEKQKPWYYKKAG